MSSNRIATTALILLIAAVLLAISALATRNAAQHEPTLHAPNSSARAASASREALQRCQRMTEPTAECSAVWAESRRHFLSRSATSSN